MKKQITTYPLRLLQLPQCKIGVHPINPALVFTRCCSIKELIGAVKGCLDERQLCY